MHANLKKPSFVHRFDDRASRVAMQDMYIVGKNSKKKTNALLCSLVGPG
jgi:hypothetical protein